MIAFADQEVYSQQTVQKIHGKIYDSETFEYIPFVHVVSFHSGTITNNKGAFELLIAANDTLLVSHVNYYQQRIATFSNKNDSLFIFLTPKENMLEEVVVYELPREEVFKSRILEIRPELTQEEINSHINVEKAQMLYRLGYAPDMNSEDNYKFYLHGRKGVSILSSDPSKGLLKAMKNVREYRNFDYTGPSTRQEFPLKPVYFNVRNDSTKIADSTNTYSSDHQFKEQQGLIRNVKP